MPDDKVEKSPEVTSEKTVYAEKKAGSNKKFILILLLLLLCSLVACVVVVVIVYLGQQMIYPCSSGVSGCSPFYTPTPSPIVTPTLAANLCGDSKGASKSRIAYIANSNVWTVNNDGSGKTQITSDGDGDTVRYTEVEWCGSDKLTYARCEDFDCTVVNHTLAGGAKVTLFSTDSEVVSVLEWSHKGRILATMTTSDASVEKIFLFTDGVNTAIKTFPAHLGRGVGFDDGLDLQFTTDDKLLVALRTFLGEGETTTISVFSNDGTELNGINTPGTHPAVIPGQNSFYYSKSGKIYRVNESGPEVVATTGVTGSEYNLTVSANGKFVAFWTLKDGEAWLGMYDTAGPSSEVHKELSYPKWLNNDDKQLIVTKTVVDGDSIDGYSTSGLYKFNRILDSVTTLDTASVANFDIER